MQGISKFISTEKKTAYLNQLIKVGFDVLDFGSFVSPKAIPQLRDTAEVLAGLDLSNYQGKLLAIIANERGAQDALHFQEIHYLGFPFSISETFQRRNTNSSIEASFETVDKIQSLCQKAGKELLIYFSMGFGNPYGDPWNQEVLYTWSEKMGGLGIKNISLADTVGVAKPEMITDLFKGLIPAFPELVFGAHFHSHPATWEDKVAAAYNSGCRSFDSAIRGFGGCPMAEDNLVGNIATENLIEYLDRQQVQLNLNRAELQTAMLKSSEVFPV
jgi:hydroxymethylglutaryl-CoA lyase